MNIDGVFFFFFPTIFPALEVSFVSFENLGGDEPDSSFIDIPLCDVSNSSYVSLIYFSLYSYVYLNIDARSDDLRLDNYSMSIISLTLVGS